MKNRLFFFANYEGRRDAQGTSVLRTVPARLCVRAISCTCARIRRKCPGGTVNGVSGVQPGYYALGPNQIKAMDPLHIGVSRAVLNILQQYPGVQRKCRRRLQHTGLPVFVERRFQLQHITLRGSITTSPRTARKRCLRAERLQNFKEPGQQQFPGQSAATTVLDDSKGLTDRPHLAHSVPRSSTIFAGDSSGREGRLPVRLSIPAVLLDGIDSISCLSLAPPSSLCPSNQFTESLNWTQKNHTFQFGGDLFLIRNNHTSYANSFSDVRTNAVYLNTGGIAGTSSPLDPANNGYPAVDGNFGPNYDSAATIVMGIFPEGDGHYNFARDGSALPQGTPINRRYAINDYEFYGQDTWRVTPRLTVTYGLRWVLEAPPYETNGYQVAPCVQAAGGGCTKQNAADWFNNTAALANAGQAGKQRRRDFVRSRRTQESRSGPMELGPQEFFSAHCRGLVARHRRWMGLKDPGQERSVHGRGGYSIMYDHFGIPIVNSFDQNGSFGLSTILGNPAGVVSPGNAPRFTCLTPGSSGQSCLPAPCPSINDPVPVRSRADRRIPLHPWQYHLRHQLGIGSKPEDALHPRLQFLHRAPAQFPFFIADCVCG